MTATSTDSSAPFRESLLIMVIGGLVTALGVLALGASVQAHFLDNRLILARYSDMLRVGQGLVFNPGERVLLIFAPLVMLIGAAPVVFVIATALTAGSIYRIGRGLGTSRLMAGLGALLYIVAAPVWMAYGTAFPLMTMFAILALEMLLGKQWMLSGALIALAALCSPEALILALVLLIYAVQQGKGWSYGLPLVGLLALALIALAAYYGPTFWDGLLTLKRSADESSLRLLAGVFIAALIGGAAVFWYAQRKRAEIALLGAWIGAYVFVVAVLLGDLDGWRFLPVIGAGAALWGALMDRQRLAAVGAALGCGITAALLVSQVSRPDTSAEQAAIQALVSGPIPSSVGFWSKDVMLRFLVTGPDKTNGASLILLDGQTQPALKRMLERGDGHGVLIRYAPKLIVDHEPSPMDVDDPALKQLNYAKLPQDESPLTLYAGAAGTGNFVDQSADVTYGPDIRLTGFAFDHSAIKAGDTLRLRLDWEFARPASRSVTVELRLQNDQGTVVEVREDLDAALFPAGPYSSYHLVTVPTAVTAGSLRLQAAVIINKGLLDRVTLATLPVSGS